MTRIRVGISGENLKLSINGHATGSEACCAAISALAYTLAGWMENNDEHIDVIEHDDLSDGHVELEARGDEYLKTAWLMTLIGLAQIAESYPKYAKIEIF